ncbi:MAG: sigma-54-dependent Fis family transcriptional regulator, partial [Candidatus Methylomirabilis sp.]|nr:sigma-54-dependent Fis family transcriptional regulator [Deltaproteobacteria bacterium]
EDLYYRLNVVPIELPPLRERRDDIPLLAALFLERHGASTGRSLDGLAAEALAALMRYDWPGNIRELENVIVRALVVTDAERIPLDALPSEVVATPQRGTSQGGVTALSYREAIGFARDRAARDYLTALLDECGGNVTRAAERARIERESMHRLLKRLGLRGR